MRCCKRYGVDVAGLVFNIILVAIAATNQTILYLTTLHAFTEITFIAGGGMCVFSFLSFVWSIIGIVRTRRRYNTPFEEWNTDMEEYREELAYGVPQNE